MGRFGKSLSETALGHAKLSDLFQDARVHDLCTVKLHGQGYVLVPSQQHVAVRPVERLAPTHSAAACWGSMQDTTCMMQVATVPVAVPLVVQPPPPETGCQPLPTLLGAAARRRRSQADDAAT